VSAFNYLHVAKNEVNNPASGLKKVSHTGLERHEGESVMTFLNRPFKSPISSFLNQVTSICINIFVLKLLIFLTLLIIFDSLLAVQQAL